MKPLKAIFYKRCISDTCAKRIRNETDKLFDGMSSYHPSVKLIVKENPTKFLDTKITKKNGEKNNTSILLKVKMSRSLVI